MKLVFQNDDFVVVDKEAGWLSVPSRMGHGEPRPIAGIELEKLLSLRIFPVHRLDAEVSGLLLFAKHAAAHREANQVFEKHLLRKEYQAWSAGPLPSGMCLGETQRWTAKLERGKKRAYEASHGKDSVTDAICVAEHRRDAGLFLEWKLFPLTGRSHQLRWEMYRHDRAILGDTLYGSESKVRCAGIALRAVALNLRLAQAEKLLTSLPEQLNVEGFTPEQLL